MKKSWLLMVLVLGVDSLYGQAGGKQTFNFLDLKLSPYIAALQGATIAQRSDNPIISTRNPALQNKGMSNRLIMSYNNYLSDVNFGNVAYSTTYKNQMINAGILYVNYGKFDGYDAAGESIGSFTADDYAFFVGSSKSINERLTLGSNFKAVYSQLYNSFASGVALDAGLHYVDTSGNNNLGFVVRNAGFVLKNYTEGIKEKMPLRIELSYSVKLSKAPFRFNILLHNLQQPNMRYIPQDGSVQSTSLDGNQKQQQIGFGDNVMRHVTLGTELILGKYTHLRFGYSHQMRRELSPTIRRGLTGFAWGFGVNLFNIHFNYASNSFFPGINTNQFSAVFNLKSLYTKKKKLD
ncbi:type IX secretion system protein PorQ [Bacteroidia bacterium]|nr:type IX secretion system protein PorQ [Bacteroidia bacterium]